MAVAAVSTSVLALTSGPAKPVATASAQNYGAVGQAAPTFARLVANAAPRNGEGKSDTASGTNPDKDMAADGDGAANNATLDDEDKEISADGPANLLAKIEAMAAAVGQIVSPQATLAPQPSLSAATSQIAASPAVASPAVADIFATPAAGDIPFPQAQTVAVGQGSPAPLAKPDGPGPDGAAAQADRGADMAKLLASLDAAYLNKDGPSMPTAPKAAAPANSPSPMPAPLPGADETSNPAQPPALAALVAELSAGETASPQPSRFPPQPGAAPMPAAPPKAPRHEAAPAAVGAAGAANGPLQDAPTSDRGREPDASAATPRDAASAAVDARREAPPPPAASDTTDPAMLAAAPSAAGGTAPVDRSAASGVPASAGSPDQSVSRQLDLLRDHRWLDRLAHDISQAANQQGHLRFQLNPEHLGALTVEIANSAAGTAIRMTADTDQARSIIADAQPRLIAEVRAQGLRVAETHVDLQQQGGGNAAFAQGQQRQSSDNSKPFVPTQATVPGNADESAPEDNGILYA